MFDRFVSRPQPMRPDNILARALAAGPTSRTLGLLSPDLTDGSIRAPQGRRSRWRPAFTAAWKPRSAAFRLARWRRVWQLSIDTPAAPAKMS